MTDEERAFEHDIIPESCSDTHGVGWEAIIKRFPIVKADHISFTVYMFDGYIPIKTLTRDSEAD